MLKIRRITAQLDFWEDELKYALMQFDEVVLPDDLDDPDSVDENAIKEVEDYIRKCEKEISELKKKLIEEGVSPNSNENKPTEQTEIRDKNPAKGKTQHCAITPRATARLNEIRPVIIEFYERLKACIQDEHVTLVNADADAWKLQAVSLLEDGGQWKEIIIQGDIEKINFDVHAKTEHKERLKGELAQNILQREDYGRISRKRLQDLFI